MLLIGHTVSGRSISTNSSLSSRTLQNNQRFSCTSTCVVLRSNWREFACVFVFWPVDKWADSPRGGGTHALVADVACLTANNPRQHTPTRKGNAANARTLLLRRVATKRASRRRFPSRTASRSTQCGRSTPSPGCLLCSGGDCFWLAGASIGFLGVGSIIHSNVN